jgi:hypothetical protein
LHFYFFFFFFNNIKNIMPNEYNNNSVGSSGCAYTNLGSYSQSYFGRGAMNSAPVMAQTRSNEIVVVPGYGGSGYNSMVGGLGGQNGGMGCSGYFNINSAYPAYSNGTCGAFSSNLCGN